MHAGHLCLLHGHTAWWFIFVAQSTTTRKFVAHTSDLFLLHGHTAHSNQSKIEKQFTLSLPGKLMKATLGQHICDDRSKRKQIRLIRKRLMPLSMEDNFCTEIALKYPSGELPIPAILFQLCTMLPTLTVHQIRGLYDNNVKHRIAMIRFSEWLRGNYLYPQVSGASLSKCVYFI